MELWWDVFKLGMLDMLNKVSVVIDISMWYNGRDMMTVSIGLGINKITDAWIVIFSRSNVV